MFDVSDIINDPDFCTDFTVLRPTGSYDAGGKWTETEAPLQRTGILLPAKNDELAMLPEGERNKETMAGYCVEDMLMGDQHDQKADVILYRGAYYRVAFTKYYDQCTLWYALMTRFWKEAPTP